MSCGKKRYQVQACSRFECPAQGTNAYCQFWFKPEQEVYGSARKVNMTYLPLIGAQADGYVTREMFGDAAAADNNIGRVGVYKMIPLG